jgi:ubiquinone/menaquinone biosynthesis C-methylase UbiE
MCATSLRMSSDPRLLDVFFDVQRGLPRQGPGSDASTLSALALCPNLPPNPAILDIGCGPGMQTVALARATGGTIAAVDTSREYLAELTARADTAGVADRITPLAADMNALPVEPESLDLIWSEGAAYIMGFENALASWRRFLKPTGYIAVTELVWLTPHPSAEAAAFFAEGYPAMTDVAATEGMVRRSGYDLVGRFVLPDSAWWDHYYTPLEAKLPALYAKYKDDANATEIVASAEREIEVRRRFPESYGYVFFVAAKS